MQFELKEFSYWYPNRSVPALDGVSLSIAENEFVIVNGASGSGKSTLARVLAATIPHFYGGRIAGSASVFGWSLVDFAQNESSRRIGVVFQDLEKQIVMNNVEREIAFGLENQGLCMEEMRRRIAEVSGLLDLGDLLPRSTHDLSSGELQKVVFASALVVQPDVLILDEPTSQLSESASHQVFSLLKRLNQEHGVTIILVEQELDQCLGYADRVLYLMDGKVVIDDDPKGFIAQSRSSFPNALPLLEQVFTDIDQCTPVLSVKDGRRVLGDYLRIASKSFDPVVSPEELGKGAGILSVRDLVFAYQGRTAFPAVDSLSLDFQQERVTAVLGPNGAGKSTLLKLLAGALAPLSGVVELGGLAPKETAPGVIGFLGQDPNSYLVADTVKQELQLTLRSLGQSDEGRIAQVLSGLGLDALVDAYPRDLSAGERQRTALASVLVMQPSFLLLDEPTRGSDTMAKRDLAALLRHYSRGLGVGIVVVTQDISFAAECADRVVILHQGKVVADGVPQVVLHDKLFYSTPINRVFRGHCDNVVSLSDARSVIQRCSNE